MRGGVVFREPIICKNVPRLVPNWTQPIDLLLLDGDQSPEGARSAYDAWAKCLKPGGILVLRNSGAHDYAEGHDGHRRLAVAEVVPGRYEEIRQLGDTMIARKASPRAAATAGGMLLNMGRERPLRVHLYAQCWNDEFMLPYFFRHYDSFVDRYVIFDDYGHHEDIYDRDEGKNTAEFVSAFVSVENLAIVDRLVRTQSFRSMCTSESMSKG